MDAAKRKFSYRLSSRHCTFQPSNASHLKGGITYQSERTHPDRHCLVQVPSAYGEILQKHLSSLKLSTQFTFVCLVLSFSTVVTPIPQTLPYVSAPFFFYFIYVKFLCLFIIVWLLWRCGTAFLTNIESFTVYPRMSTAHIFVWSFIFSEKIDFKLYAVRPSWIFTQMILFWSLLWFHCDLSLQTLFSLVIHFLCLSLVLSLFSH